jgi:uncharacterized protein YjbI with pentapeptide repeats
MKTINLKQFLEKVKNKENVSRFDFELSFKWNKTNSNKLLKLLANLRFADLSFADLSFADLRYANLSYANLRYANLSFADLRFADLSFADLRFADLSYADLSYANLSYADLHSAKGEFVFNYNVKLKVVEVKE